MTDYHCIGSMAKKRAVSVLKGISADLVSRISSKGFIESFGMDIRGMGEHDKALIKYTEATIAEAFCTAILDANFRYGSEWFMWFNGVKYVLTRERQMYGAIQAAMRGLNVGRIYVQNSAERIVRTALSDLAGKPYDGSRGLISFRNGVLRLDDMKMLEPDESLETTVYIDLEYDRTAGCPRFLTFLSEVLPDASAQRVLQEYCGAMFVDRSRYAIQQTLYLLGEGQNGKGVFLSSIQSTIGHENYTAYSMADICTSSYRANNVANMVGKLVNICTDMSKADVSGGEFKKFVAGEPMVGKWLYKDTFMTTDIPISMAAMNDMPRTSDHSFGHARRHIVVPFDQRIPDSKVDPELANKLKVEAPGILNWMFQGRSRFLGNGAKFSRSGIVDKTIERVKREQDVILSFMANRQYMTRYRQKTERFEIDNDDLYAEYVDYCKTSGHKPFSRQSFLQNLSRKEEYKTESVRMNNGRRGKVLYRPVAGYVYDEEIDEVVDFQAELTGQLKAMEFSDDIGINIGDLPF